MNKSESKYFHTAALMDQALLKLLEKKPFAYITVKEICETAGVNRSTFYLHYETMDDLVSECLQNATREMERRFTDRCQIDQAHLEACQIEELNLITPEYLRPYLEFVRDNKALFRAVLQHPNVFQTEQSLSELYAQIVNPIFDRYHFPDWEKRYRLAFYLHGIWAILEQWLRDDCADDIENMIRLIIHCVTG